MKFEDLKFEPHPVGDGIRARHTFPNGYGVSVVRFTIMGRSGSYGSERGLYEIGILKDGNLTYDTPITDDVLGYQTEAEVTEVMAKVEALREQERD